MDIKLAGDLGGEKGETLERRLVWSKREGTTRFWPLKLQIVFFFLAVSFWIFML